MRYQSTNGRNGAFKTLRRLAQGSARRERCSLCSREIPPFHRHLLEVATRKLVCSCDPCALRFQNVVGGRFKLVPRDVLVLPELQLSDERWERLALPINLAFFFQHTGTGKVAAMYPSPAGAMESLLPLEHWHELAAENPALEQIEPDVEALLANRLGATRKYFIAPLDVCYELVGVIRTRWRGLSGGEEVWREVEEFFRRLALRAQASSFVPEVSHA